MKWFLDFIQKNGTLKLLVSVILLVIFGVLFDYTDNSIYIKLMLIPCIYIVPLFITGFVYAFIIWPISLIKKKK